MVSPRRKMPPVASWFFDTGDQNHHAGVLECPPAELAGEITEDVAAYLVVVFTIFAHGVVLTCGGSIWFLVSTRAQAFEILIGNVCP